MNKTNILLSSGVVVIVAILGLSALASAVTAVQVGGTGKTYASSAVRCAVNPATVASSPVVEAGLYNPKKSVSATVSLNGSPVATVTAANPATNVWLADGNNTVVVAINRRATDSYAFTVQPGQYTLPDTSGNTFSPDGLLEYGASRKSYATVTPGCALNRATGQAQPYVNLFDNGTYLLNVSVNGVPLTQLSGTRPHTSVFLGAGLNVISAATGSLSTDYYVRDGGTGTCTLP